jgi:hypothetical protein
VRQLRPEPGVDGRIGNTGRPETRLSRRVPPPPRPTAAASLRRRASPPPRLSAAAPHRRRASPPPRLPSPHRSAAAPSRLHGLFPGFFAFFSSRTDPICSCSRSITSCAVCKRNSTGSRVSLMRGAGGKNFGGYLSRLPLSSTGPIGVSHYWTLNGRGIRSHDHTHHRKCRSRHLPACRQRAGLGAVAVRSPGGGTEQSQRVFPESCGWPCRR